MQNNNCEATVQLLLCLSITLHKTHMATGGMDRSSTYPLILPTHTHTHNHNLDLTSRWQ